MEPEMKKICDMVYICVNCSAVLTYSRSFLTPGATASYTCNPGYEFVGTHICKVFDIS
jgi:hypothetical protein